MSDSAQNPNAAQQATEHHDTPMSSSESSGKGKGKATAEDMPLDESEEDDDEDGEVSRSTLGLTPHSLTSLYRGRETLRSRTRTTWRR